MLKLYFLLASVGFCFSPIIAQLSTYSNGLGGGEWFDNTIWTNNTPSCGLSLIEIDVSDDVTLDNSYNIATCPDPVFLGIKGSLLLTESNLSIDLPCNSEVYVYKFAKILDISPDGGNSISICGQIVWEFDQNPSALGITHMFVNSLPVELAVFDVQTINNRNIIHWVTESETNNSHFILERSYDGMLFEPITTTMGAGDSKIRQSYSFVDDNFSANTVYYRLKQYDFDGTMSLSPVIAAQNDPISNDVLVFPNPSSSDIHIVTERSMLGEVAQLLDLNGRVVRSFPINDTTVLMERGTLPSGIYHLQIMKDGMMKHEKIQIVN